MHVLSINNVTYLLSSTVLLEYIFIVLQYYIHSVVLAFLAPSNYIDLIYMEYTVMSEFALLLSL